MGPTNRNCSVSPLQTASARVRISGGRSRLVRLGVVYASSLRLTILTELNMRDMSPTQFFNEVGGPSKEGVRKHFAKLYEYDWLVRVRRQSGGRGRPGYVYRTKELAVIDDETWAEIPMSIRDAFTLQLMQQFSERWAMAAEERTLETRSDRVLSLLPACSLDERAWKKCLALLEDCFLSLEQAQTAARERLAMKDEEPGILMVVALAGFESPGPAVAARPVLPISTAALHTNLPWTIRLAKVFGDPINLEMVRALNETPMSPSQMEAKIGQAPKQTYDRRCKILVDLGWATQVGHKTGGRRRGSREVFYRATAPAVSPEQMWAIISPSYRSGASWATYKMLCQLVFTAVKSGTFNARLDRHLTWVTLLLDEIGWTYSNAALRECSDRLLAISRETGSGSASSFTFFLAGFESPPLKTRTLANDSQVKGGT
jgi:hypothetical protein